MSALSERLTNLRENKGWSKTYVAKAIGLNSMPTYANYEYGRREPDLETLSKLANLFNVTTDYLLNGSNKEQNESKTADLADDDVIFTYEGKQIPPEDLEYMKRILRGGKA
ncbi:helix-turn-helix domain-containing protein [Limosilactobacillus caecicola]|uniref:helix-turn-helix domain-containing protein n=1 Tax=Limosilactobacillus caecicola TaxID=2941332 RepID=UPI00203AE2A6|nr:helix-turn-helix transcriptional regulator [Limosilactobacillus caecicola]